MIPLSCVEKCIELDRELDWRSTGRAFITLRDSLVPFLRLRELIATATTPFQIRHDEPVNRPV